MNYTKRILLSYPHMSGDEIKLVQQAFDSNWIAPLGPMVDRLEQKCVLISNMPHALALSSGSAAIHLGLRLLGIQTGDVVFCSTLTFIASAAPAVQLGAKLVFIDSAPDSWNMSPVALQKAFEAAKQNGQLPKAVIVAELYGQCPDMDKICEVCSCYGVPILEDAAEALGSTWKGKPCGSLGALGIYSFNGNKIITTSGGGMLLTQEKKLRDKAFFWATQARDQAPWYEHSELGYNYRMSNIAAAIGVGQIQHLTERVKRRREIFSAYAEGLKNIPGIEMMPLLEGCFCNCWLSCITISPQTGKSFMDILTFLNERNIESRPIWKPMHQQPVFKGHLYYTHDEDESISDQIFSVGLCLPSCSAMSEEEQSLVIQALHDAFH